MTDGGGNTKDGLSEGKVDLWGLCSLRVKANSVQYVQCGKCGVQLKNRKLANNLLLMLGLNVTICNCLSYDKQCSLVWSCVEER